MKTNLKGIFTSVKADGELIPYLESYRVIEFISYLLDQKIIYSNGTNQTPYIKHLKNFLETLEV